MSRTTEQLSAAKELTAAAERRRLKQKRTLPAVLRITYRLDADGRPIARQRKDGA
jgi:hypothetical protein